MVMYEGYEIKTVRRNDVGIGTWEATIYCEGAAVARYMGFTRDEAIEFAKAYINEVGPCGGPEEPDLPEEELDPEIRIDVYVRYINDCSYSRREAKKDLSEVEPELSDEKLDEIIDGWQDSRDLLDCPEFTGLDIDLDGVFKIGLFAVVLYTVYQLVK